MDERCAYLAAARTADKGGRETMLARDRRRGLDRLDAAVQAIKAALSAFSLGAGAAAGRGYLPVNTGLRFSMKAVRPSV